MKFLLFIVFFTAASAQAKEQANEWTKILDCSDGGVVLDSKYPGHGSATYFQLVVREAMIIEQMLGLGSVPRGRLNSKGELIFFLRENYPSWFTNFDYISEDDAYPNDGSLGRIHIVQPRGTELSLTSFVAERPQPLGPYRQGPMVGRWDFAGCRRF